jgi:hypothetical protein
MKPPGVGGVKNSCDGSDLHPFAKRVPAVHRGGSPAVQKLRAQQHDALVRIVDQLMKYPGYILPVQNELLNGNLLFKAEDIAEKGEWTGDYKSLGKIPESWMMDFLRELAENQQVPQITLEKLKSVSAHSSDNIDLLFSTSVQLPTTMPFPEDMADVVVALRTLKARSEEVGARLRILVNGGGLKADGSVVCGPGAGSYDILFRESTDGYATSIIHCQSKLSVPFPSHIKMDRTWLLIDNHLDHLARVEKHPCRYFLRDLFPPDAAFKRCMPVQGKKFHLLSQAANRFKVLVDAEKSKVEKKSVGEAATDACKEAAKERNKVQMAAARVKIAEAAQARKKRRTLTLGSAEEA